MSPHGVARPRACWSFVTWLAWSVMRGREGPHDAEWRTRSMRLARIGRAMNPDTVVARRHRQYTSAMIVAHFPGAELIGVGLADLTSGLVTIESLLVSIAAPGLRDVGLSVGQPIPDAELQLYALLSARHGLAAHSHYNALLRRVASFRHAAACAS